MLRLIETQHQAQQRGLATTGVPDDAVEGAGRHRQIQVTHDRMCRIVTETQVRDLQRTRTDTGTIDDHRRGGFLE